MSVRLDANVPDGFLVNSFSGDDWCECRDYVRKRLGLPDWQPGDEQRRRINPSAVRKWDTAALAAEINKGPRAWTEDELIRISAARPNME